MVVGGGSWWWWCKVVVVVTLLLLHCCYLVFWRKWSSHWWSSWSWCVGCLVFAGSLLVVTDCLLCCYMGELPSLRFGLSAFLFVFCRFSFRLFAVGRPFLSFLRCGHGIPHGIDPPSVSFPRTPVVVIAVSRSTTLPRCVRSVSVEIPTSYCTERMSGSLIVSWKVRQRNCNSNRRCSEP